MKDRQHIVKEAMLWIMQADDAVKSVGGGGADIILEGMSDELLYTMVSNGLMITAKEVK